MTITRVFLDWNRPALPAAAEFLLSRFGRGDDADLSRVVVVLQSRRAGRRLLEILVEQADEKHLSLSPPHITTVGSFPELLYQDSQNQKTERKPLAGELVQRLAWTSALRGCDLQQLSKVVARPPAPDDDQRWMELGEMLQTLHRELAGDLLDFGEVASQVAKLEGELEPRRWNALAQIQSEYLKTLLDLNLWDKQTARRVAIRQKECATGNEIVLVGAVDINVATRRMLDQIAERVTALVVAPEALADRFDSHGCLVPAEWEAVRVPIDDGQVFVADSVADQAASAVRRIAEFDGRYRADEISIGLADERLVPQVERQLDQCDLPARWGPGQSIDHSPPVRLLSAVAGYLRSGRFSEFASLSRHPDIFSWLVQQKVGERWLAELDEYYNRFLPARLGDSWRGSDEKYPALRSAHAKIAELVKPLTGERPLSQWGPPLSDLLREVYGERQCNRDDAADRLTLEACQEIDKALLEFGNIPDALAPTVSAVEAIRLALDQVAGQLAAAPADAAAIELLGWLELALDDAPALVVTGFNEGFVPKSVTSDLFLPNRLRQRLNVEDNARRYARDVYTLHVLSASRAELRLIVGRRDVENNPLAPSRLLFAADRETIARRALRFFATPATAAAERPLAGGLFAMRDRPNFPIPRPLPLTEPIDKLSPSAVKTYLQCPYRFYLAKVLRLEAVDDAAAELDGAAFGNLAHDALLDFAGSELRHSTDAAEIARALDEALNDRARQTFGKQALTPVDIQIEQLRLRLRAFAERQAEQAAAGWRIEHWEAESKPVAIAVDGQEILLSGRIDRIDRHQETGEWFIFDYKTGDAGTKPDSAHRSRGEWVDLQLPLYRHLARGLDIEGPVRLGYIVLPKDPSKVAFLEAEWSDDELQAADETFFRVVRAIRREQFWPPADPPPSFSEWLACICQDAVLDRSPDALQEADL